MSHPPSPWPLPPPLRLAVEELGFAVPTPVQAATLPPLLAGRDVLARARTGSGKTAAYGLPAIAAVDLSVRRVQVLVLVPTRELALQVTADLRALGKRSPGLRVVPVVGGQPGAVQARTLAEGAHVVVGTPGRTVDHLRRSTLDVGAVRLLVLDEADRLLELGFAAELEAARAALPEGRQTALFSATYPDGVARLSAGWQRDVVVVEVEEPPSPDVASFAAEAPDKARALPALLRALQPASALVFCNFKRVVDEVTAALVAAGFDAAALHGDVDQVDRDRVLAGFRNGSVRVLVATDVAARGLDITGLPLVVNAQVTPRAEDHVHRVGRTGRAGEPGLAWSLLDPGAPLPAGAVRAPLPEPAAGAPPLRAAWRTLWLGAGRRDKLRPADLLGALTGDCGLTAAQVGRFELHDRWAFAAVATEVAEQALKGLQRHGVKGRKVRVAPA
jgi:ATP-independent RNA helicase DbpA